MNTVSQASYDLSNGTMLTSNRTLAQKQPLEANKRPLRETSAFRLNKVSETWRERAAAFRLVHREYLRSGLTADNRLQMRVMKHHLLDTTDVLVSEYQGNVDFTVTLVRDGLHGLPAESLFSSEIEEMRSAGYHLAEISCVASGIGEENGNKKQCFENMVSMISLTYQTARRRGIDRLVMAVHPRHAKVYRRLFGCSVLTDVREYQAVQGNPAVLCSHDFAERDEVRYPLYDQMYGQAYEPWQMDGVRMSSFEKQYFQEVLESQSSSSQSVPMAA